MKILALARDIPATSRMPGSPRFFHFCRELSRQHSLILVAMCNSDERKKAFEEDPQSQGVFQKIFILPPRPKTTWWGRQNHRLHLASHLLLKYSHAKYYSEICQLTQRYTKEYGADVVLVDGLQMSQYLFFTRDVPAVLDLADSMTLLFSRIAAREPATWRKLMLQMECWGVSRWEKILPRYFPRLVVISEVDKDAILQLNPEARLSIIANGVDREYFRFRKNSGTTNKLVFTGVMGYGPNEDGAVFFVREVFPIVRETMREVQFFIVGQGPTAVVRDLAREPGVTVTGTVDDIRPYVWDSTIYVCPLRFGAGVKNKVLSALSLGTPVVTTSIGAEGIGGEDGRHYLIADTPEQFAAAILRICQNRELARTLVENGVNLIDRKYSWHEKGELLEKELIDVTFGQNSSSKT